MAAAQLPGTILSDDESDVAGLRDDGPDAKRLRSAGKTAKRPSADDGDDSATDDEMDGDFEFGGLLGEDLGGGGLIDALGVAHTTSASWSYKSALALLARNDGAGAAPGTAVERTSVASIIAAARSNMRRGKPGGGDGEEEGSGSGSGSQSSDSSSSGESSSGESSDDEVDDAERAGEMEEDVLKVREAPTPRAVRESQAEEASKDKGESDSDGSDEDGDASEAGELSFSLNCYSAKPTRSIRPNPNI